MCYAYKDSKKEEELIEHLITTANICLKRWELEALSLKVSRLLNIDMEKVKEAVILASMLHDIGKAAEIYQKECFNGICTRFQGHYLVSAFILHLVLNVGNVRIEEEDVEKFLTDNFNRLGKDKIYAMLIVLPVAFHHYHQVRGFESFNASVSEVVLQFLEDPRICARCLEKAGNMLSYDIVGKSDRRFIEQLYYVLRSIEQYVDSDVYRNSKIFIRNLFSVVKKDLKSFAEYPITLGKTIIESVYGLVNFCDGWAASMKRR